MALFLGALVILYVTNFYTVAADRLAPISVHGDGDAGSPPSLAPQQRAAYAAAAVRPPGSAVSSSAAFEAHDPPRGRSAMNTLPGAIGLNGPFDSSSEAPAAPASSPGDAGGSGSTAAAASADQAAVIISAKPPSEEAPTDASTPSAAAPSGDAAVDVERGTTATTTAAVIEAAQATPPQAAASPPETAVAGEAAAASAAGASSESETAADAGSAEAGDDPNVIRDGLGHVIPQKKKKRKRRRRRASVTGRGESGPAGDEPAAGPAAASSPASEAEGSSSAGGARPPPAEELSSMSMPPVDVGDHPMSGRLTELQVDAETGPLDATAVKKTYRKLVKAYLAPFKGGIKRRAFFDVLRRKNYSLAPPESNKGIQTILLQVISKKIYMMDPYEVAKNSKAFYRTRIKEIIWLLAKVARERDTPDTEFLVAIHDCVQTVSKKHAYRGAHYMESSPTFTIVACNFSDNIPFPMWEGDDQRGGGLNGWDSKMNEYRSSDRTPWAEKKDQAVFRGGYRASMFFAEKRDADVRCDDAGRSRLAFLARESPDLYDVSISGKCGATRHSMTRLSEAMHHEYKFILYAEGNCFWADRLNKQVFGPSAILKQETPCGQFWEPLLRPMTHYLPTDFFFGDTTERITWAKAHSAEAERVVKNANEFASNFLSLSGIESYVEVLLTEYTKLLEVKVLEVERGSFDVTSGKLADE